MKLKDKVAVITGGNSGIGLAIAREFARQGASVVIHGRNERTLRDAEKSMQGPCLAVQGDVSRPGDLDRLYELVGARFGRVDVVVANAGWGEISPFEQTSEEQFDSQIGANFKGAFFTVQKALPLMREGSTVVMVSSIAGIKGFPGMSVYGGAKAAMRSLARTLTSELSPRGIRVNVLSPGPVDTPAFERMPGLSREALEQFGGMTPQGRPGQAEEMARAALFLASDDSSYVSGADLVADGGMAHV